MDDQRQIHRLLSAQCSRTGPGCARWPISNALAPRSHIQERVLRLVYLHHYPPKCRFAEPWRAGVRATAHRVIQRQCVNLPVYRGSTTGSLPLRSFTGGFKPFRSCTSAPKLTAPHRFHQQVQRRRRFSRVAGARTLNFLLRRSMVPTRFTVDEHLADVVNRVGIQYCFRARGHGRTTTR